MKVAKSGDEIICNVSERHHGLGLVVRAHGKPQ